MESVFITIKQLLMLLNRKNPVLSATEGLLKGSLLFLLKSPSLLFYLFILR